MVWLKYEFIKSRPGICLEQTELIDRIKTETSGVFYLIALELISEIWDGMGSGGLFEMKSVRDSSTLACRHNSLNGYWFHWSCISKEKKNLSVSSDNANKLFILFFKGADAEETNKQIKHGHSHL